MGIFKKFFDFFHFGDPFRSSTKLKKLPVFLFIIIQLKKHIVNINKSTRRKRYKTKICAV